VLFETADLGAALLAGKTVSATVARERTPVALKAERTRAGRVAVAMERMAIEQVINAVLLKADIVVVVCCLFASLLFVCCVITTDNLLFSIG
jgi:sensor histidine kinase regulating citrate/malate metabolism